MLLAREGTLSTNWNKEATDDDADTSTARFIRHA